MSITIRPARAGDGPIVHAMVRELAVHHGYEKNFVARVEDYEKFLADPHALNGALIAFLDGEPAGCATWQRSYQTFLGRETIVPPVADKPQARTKALPTPSQRRKQQGLKQTQGLRQALGGRNSPPKASKKDIFGGPSMAPSTQATDSSNTLGALTNQTLTQTLSSSNDA